MNSQIKEIQSDSIGNNRDSGKCVNFIYSVRIMYYSCWIALCEFYSWKKNVMQTGTNIGRKKIMRVTYIFHDERVVFFSLIV